MIDAMTLFDVAELTRYWAAHPPAHVALAAFLGVKPRPPSAPPATLAAALGAAGPGFTAGDVAAGLPPVELDFTALARAAAVARG